MFWKLFSATEITDFKLLIRPRIIQIRTNQNIVRFNVSVRNAQLVNMRNARKELIHKLLDEKHPLSIAAAMLVCVSVLLVPLVESQWHEVRN